MALVLSRRILFQFFSLSQNIHSLLNKLLKVLSSQFSKCLHLSGSLPDTKQNDNNNTYGNDIRFMLFWDFIYLSSFCFIYTLHYFCLLCFAFLFCIYPHFFLLHHLFFLFLVSLSIINGFFFDFLAEVETKSDLVCY